MEKGNDKLGKIEEKGEVMNVKGDNGESSKDSDVSVISSQSLLPEEDLGWGEIEDIDESKGKLRKPETCLFRKQFLATRTRPGTDDGEKEEEDKSNRSLPEVKALREKGDDKLEKTEEKAPAVEVRGDDDEWCKDSDVSVVSGQLLCQRRTLDGMKLKILMKARGNHGELDEY
ncbi:hypothetical protein GH714_002777 [Hevea brasiliensis]|uniref:Uncharacterized protein n=1 Tax=Hevea brasiliensis TaxID=3981 RepID=A0A6A6KHB9_HEVBR|nr:hypothetical protein GH714_002777 [Hevea brasiliensis]